MSRLILWIVCCGVFVYGQNYRLSNLKDTQSECDFLIVCKSMFEQKAREHAHYRAVSAADEISKPGIALLEDIYAAFPDSSSSEEKLRQFLLYTSEHWKQKPRFILLVGDPPSYGERETSYNCPTFFVPDTELRTDYVPTDDRLLKSDWTGTCFAASGRLPVRTVAEYDAILSKIKIFENRKDFYSRRILSVYDDDKRDATCSLLDFYGASLSIEPKKSRVVPNIVLNSIEYDADSEHRKRFLEDSIARHINNGVSFVSYFGMGGKNIWSDEAILTADSILAKIHDERISIFLSFTSNSNRYQERDNSIGTKLLLCPGKGAVASLGAPNLGQYMSTLEVLQNSVWRNYAKFNTLGELFYHAKSDAMNESITLPSHIESIW